ncbi:MAG: Hot dog fold protein HP0420 [uncultured Sulfurovum sp.]|uniref:Hot dog fold protein HP0420 n=1 Tax=uncultured Sulfurovum sp. TaxID=269237 RepID=A0A6S6SDM5_9BACT|nr:MAG: Hot dog fold protein HP0420 [uncultured Sulfurovum sp.]
MELKTHLKLDNTLNGELLELKEGYAKVVLKTIQNMVADAEGLIHGGFIFGAADFTAMATVNDPYVVLAKSETKFLAPVKVGQSVTFQGKNIESNARKQTIEVTGTIENKKVFVGTFYTVVLDTHVLNL